MLYCSILILSGQWLSGLKDVMKQRKEGNKK
jgi:hypothetical protein